MELTTRDRLAIGLGGLAVACLLAGGWLLAAAALSGATGGALPTPGVASASALAVSTGASPSSATELVVDVQGAVRNPGVVLLPPGARVADALHAAGGYSGRADLNAAAASLNLAAPLADGAQVFVPMLGGVAGAGSLPSASGAAGGGLVNVNTAPPEALEALPGIGPVTVQKIVAGRAQHPFTSLDEMVQREVIDRGQLEDITGLVTF
jgi:competence protein ComEA